MKNSELIECIYDQIEADEVDKAVMSCLRLARKLKDYVNIAIFLREQSTEKKQLADAFYNETQNLKKEAQKYLWEQAVERWLKERTVDWDTKKTEDEKFAYVKGVGEIKPDIEQLERMIDDMKIPQGMGEYDTAAFTDQYDLDKANIRMRIRDLITVKERIKSRCLNYAIQIEKQLENQEQSGAFIYSVYNEVNNYFKSRNEDVYNKLQKATQFANSENTEDHSLLLTSIRRVIVAVADYLYPSVEQPVICSDGKERKLGNEQYLNRLHEYLKSHFSKSSANELLMAELEYLSVFVRKLNDIASKGVHTNVSYTEARQGLVGLYMFLFNLMTKIQEKDS